MSSAITLLRSVVVNLSCFGRNLDLGADLALEFPELVALILRGHRAAQALVCVMCQLFGLEAGPSVKLYFEHLPGLRFNPSAADAPILHGRPRVTELKLHKTGIL